MFPLRFLGLPFPILAAVLVAAQFHPAIAPPGGMGPATRSPGPGEKDSPPVVSSEGPVTAAELQIPAKVRDLALRAEAALLHHQAKEAEGFADRALRAEPQCARAMVVKAILRVNEGKMEEGFGWIRRAISADREYPRSYVALGAAYNLKRQYGAAQEALATALHLAPSLWQAHLEMAKALLGIARYEEGLRELARTEELYHQSSAETCLLKGWGLMKLKRYAESRTELKEFLKLAPDSSQSQPAREWLAQMPVAEAASGK